MFKVLALICILLGLSGVHSQSCQSTRTLRTSFGFSNSVSSPTNASGLSYCKSLKNSAVCCTASDINSIQTKASNMVTNLTSLVTSRDTYLKTLQTTVLPAMKQSLSDFVSNVDSYSSLFDNPPTLSGVNETDLTNALTTLSEITTALSTVAGSIKSKYSTYQTKRVTCVEGLVKFQAALFCSACDPYATNKGYNSTSNTFSFSSTTCTRLQGLCSDYFVSASYQNVLIAVSASATIVNSLNDILTAVAKGDSATVKRYLYLFNNVVAPTGIQAVVESPCSDDGTCPWICDSNGLFANGVLDQWGLVLGGSVDGYDSRLLVQKRMLTSSSSFEPDEDEAGVSVTFESDPADTQSGSFGSLSFGNVFLSMMVVISSVLLF